MRIGIYGGAFDPPHVSHVMAVAYALSVHRLDKLFVIPCWGHGFGKEMSRFEDRDRMCREAFEVFGDKVKVLPDEAFWRTTYTIEMLRHLRTDTPYIAADDIIVLIMGADEWNVRDKWHCWDEIEKLVEVAVVGREGVTAEGLEIRCNLPPISSTTIRGIIKIGQSELCRTMVPAKVLDYIDKYKIYR